MVNSTWELVSLSEILSHIMLAYRTFASISELGPAVAYDCRPMYLFMFAGLSSAGISDIGPTAPELPAGNMSASQSSASIVLILFKPWHKTSWPMYRSMLGGLSSAGMSDLGPTAAKDCRFFCQYFFFLFSFILV